MDNTQTWVSSKELLGGNDLCLSSCGILEFFYREAKNGSDTTYLVKIGNKTFEKQFTQDDIMVRDDRYCFDGQLEFFVQTIKTNKQWISQK